MAKFDLAAALNLQPVSKLDTSGLQQIDVHLLDPHPYNFFPVEDDLSDLAASIQLHGVLQPLVVVPTEGGRYRVIAGHRRRAAALTLAKDGEAYLVPCNVQHPKSPELEELMLIQTNTEAREIGWSVKNEAATRVEKILVKLQQEQKIELPGKMRSHVARLIKASESQIARAKYISEHLITECKTSEINDSTAYALAHLPAEDQKVLFRHYKANLWRLSPATINAYKENIEAGREPFYTPPAEARDCYVRKSKKGKFLKCDNANRPSGCNESKCCYCCIERFDCHGTCTHIMHDLEIAKKSLNYQTGLRIEAARKAAGKSIADAMAIRNWSETQVREIERNAGKDIQDIVSLSEAYGVTPNTLLGFRSGWNDMESKPKAVGQLCLILVVDNVTIPDHPRLAHTWEARWNGTEFLSAANGNSRTMFKPVAWMELPELPDGYSLSISEAIGDD